MSTELSNLINLYKNKKFLQAEKKCSELIKKVKPNHELLNLYAIILFELKKYEQSIVQLKKSIEINPNYFQGYNSLGNVFLKKNEFDEAIKSYDKAIKLKNDYFEAYHNRGNAYLKLKKIDKAINNYNLATKFNPNYLAAYKSKVDLYYNFKNYEQALIEIENVLRLDPSNDKIYQKRGDIFAEKNQLDLALRNYENAYTLNPDEAFLLGSIQITKNKMCYWSDFFQLKKEVENKILDKKKISPPYTATTIYDSPKLQLECSKVWQNEYKFENKINFKFNKKFSKKIKIGFFSADFRTHAMGHLMVKMLEQHDKSMFELYGFYFGPKLNPSDELQNRIIKCFNNFRDVSLMTDLEAAELSRKLDIDIAVDFMCYTGDYNRFGIFLQRAAPIQINFLGYPGTSGSKCMDYIVADKTLISEDDKKFYSEKIIYLPDTYQPNEDFKKVSENLISRQSLGLTEGSFVFCCFNSHQKINPIIFDVWLDILKKTEKSVLWLLKDNKFSEKNIKIYCEENKVDPDRLIFADHVNLEDHLQRIKYADLFLDTFPYNAHTTCSDALRMNIPVLTLKGNSFASRVASSLLNTLDLSELITHDINQYKDTALKIYKNTSYLKNLNEKIKNNKVKSNLFNSKIYTKNIEKAYQSIYKNYIDGNKPKDLEL